MKRFLKVLALLIVGLFALVSGVDATLDHMTLAGTQNSFVWYTDKGQMALDYHGDLTLCQAYTKPVPVAPSGLLHRGARGSAVLF